MIKINKIISFVIMFFIMLTAFTVNSYATSCSEIETVSTTFKNEGEKQFKNLDENYSTKNLGNTVSGEIVSSITPIYRMLTVAGILIIGICIVILGIQWVLSSSSPEAQGKLKQKLVALAVSAGVLFGSYTIWKIVATILDSIDG